MVLVMAASNRGSPLQQTCRGIRSNEKPAAAFAGRVKVLPSGKDNGWTEEFRRLAAPFARSLPRWRDKRSD
jgi:hypothetical protein